MFAFSGVRSLSRIAFFGDTLYLPCGAAETVVPPVDWLYQASPDNRGHFIISGGFLVNGAFSDRLNISGSTLIIKNIKKEDGGVYTCVEDAGTGTRHRIVLTVQGK